MPVNRLRLCLAPAACLLEYLSCGLPAHTAECTDVPADAEGFVPIFNRVLTAPLPAKNEF